MVSKEEDHEKNRNKEGEKGQESTPKNKVEKGEKEEGVRSADKTWVSYDSSIWSAVEVDVGLICASAPATWKLVKKVAPRFAEAMTSGRSSSSASSSGRQEGRGRSGGGSSGGTDDALNDAGGGGGPQSSSSDDSTQGHSSKNNDMSGDLP